MHNVDLEYVQSNEIIVQFNLSIQYKTIKSDWHILEVLKWSQKNFLWHFLCFCSTSLFGSSFALLEISFAAALSNV